MPEVGTIIDPSVIKKTLYEMNELKDAWKGQTELLTDTKNALMAEAQTSVADAAFAAQQQTNTLKTDYMNSIADAYRAALSQRQSIDSSGLITSGQEVAKTELNTALENAYKTNLASYQSGESQIQSNLATQTATIQKNLLSQLESLDKSQAAIDEDLNEYATNASAFLTSPFEYLSVLAENNPELLEDPNFSPYVNKTLVNGEYQYSVKSLDDIMNVAFDEAGSLTDEGKRFMAMMLANNEYGFNDYLYSENNDLYNWLVADKGANRNIALSTIGMEDYNWSPITAEQATKAGATGTVDGAPVTDLNKQFGFTLVKGSKIRDTDNDNFTVSRPRRESDPVTPTGWANPQDAKEISYALEISKESVDESLTNKIDKAVGGIQDNQLYLYDGRLYVGIKRTDKKTGKETTKLRLVQGQGINSATQVNNLIDDLKRTGFDDSFGARVNTAMANLGQDILAPVNTLTSSNRDSSFRRK